MIPAPTVMRVARPTDHLQEIGRMYTEGPEFEMLASFENHEGFDGIVLGHKGHPWHLEFTHHHGVSVGKAPTSDNLLVFYVADEKQWERACERAEKAGFAPVPSYNPYWDTDGRTFEDLDGYRVVLQNQQWSP